MREVAPVRASRAPPFRLPDSVKPRHYRIDIEPDLAASTLSGQVVVDLDIVKSTNIIAFHALRCNVTRATVKLETGDVVHPEVHYQPEHEIAYVQLKDKLSAGSTAVLTLNYDGKMSAAGSMGGMSPCRYQTPSGEMKLGFDTMMEPTMARSVFPCLDEPDLKASFAVSLTVDSDLTCLSNMEIASEEAAASHSAHPKKTVSFRTTPKMSTYLVVMVAGYFNFLESNDFHVPIRVWASSEKDIKNTAYALEIAVKAMTAYEKIFGLKYPLPKLDMVAVPGHQGGMEHWGCVTYEERGLILNDNSSAHDKMRLAQLVTHELGHQWFGNIVTMKWWDSVWLNESFSDWATLHVLSEMLPEFDSWGYFLASDPSSLSSRSFQAALDIDSNIGSHAIQDPNIPPAAAFDHIAYLKGCSIIRMMAEDLGIDVFLKGVKHYLKKHMYGNATTEDLWDALSEVSGQDVASTMATWTQTVGYPLLTVGELRPTGEIVVTQSRFLQNGDDDTEAKVHPVSIHLRGPDGVTTYRMTGSEIKIPANLFQYKLNADHTGFYRVSYPLSRIHKFGVQFAGGFLSTKDQTGIISDLGAVVATGASSRRVRLSDFLDFLFRIKDYVEDLFVWCEIFDQLGKVRAAFLFEGDEVLEILKSVRWKLLAPLIGKYSLEFKADDTFTELFFKTLLFSQLKDHPLAQGVAANSWNKLLHGDRDALNPNVKRMIFDTVVLLDDTDETWHKLKSIAFEKAYFASTDPITPWEALHAMGSATKPEIIARTLDIITPTSPASALSLSTSPKSSAGVAPLVLTWGQRSGVLTSLRQHPGGAQASWDWLQDNWDLLRKTYSNGSIGGYVFVGQALAGLATAKHLSQAEKYFEGRIEEASKLGITQAIDVIRARARFVEADRDDLLAWARQRGLS